MMTRLLGLYLNSEHDYAPAKDGKGVLLTCSYKKKAMVPARERGIQID